MKRNWTTATIDDRIRYGMVLRALTFSDIHAKSSGTLADMRALALGESTVETIQDAQFFADLIGTTLDWLVNGFGPAPTLEKLREHGQLAEKGGTA